MLMQLLCCKLMGAHKFQQIEQVHSILMFIQKSPCVDMLVCFAKVTWEGAFAKHAMALPNQLAVPQAEKGAEEIPKCRLGRCRTNAFTHLQNNLPRPLAM